MTKIVTFKSEYTEPNCSAANAGPVNVWDKKDFEYYNEPGKLRGWPYGTKPPYEEIGWRTFNEAMALAKKLNAEFREI